MYVNKCIKCGREFETKNPKRVICPDCLYPDKKMMVGSTDSPVETPEQAQPSVSPEVTENHQTEEQTQFYSSYSSGGEENPRPYNRPQGGYNRDNRQGGYNNNYNNRQGGYNNNRPQGGYNRDNRQGGYNNNYNNRQGGYSQGGYNNNRPQGGYNRDNRQGGYNNNYNNSQGGGYSQGGYNNNRPQGGYNRDNRQGGFNNNRPQNNRFNNNRRPMNNNRNRAPKQLLISREQLEQIELLYKLMLPLPNPDAHEVIGEKIGLEPRKVFFGINLVRQKMMLPKLPFPKRKLAITPDQLNAIKMLYEPLLPLPPIGCHKIIASQLKMDEWRVHVGIGLVRAQMGLERWNQERADAPEEFKKQKAEADKVASKEEKKTAKAKTTAKAEEKAEEVKSADETVTSTEEKAEEAPKKRRGRPKKTENEE